MKTLKFVIASVLVWIILGVGIVKAAEYTKQYKKEFTVDAKTLLKVDNRYGDVTISNWESNKAYLEVTVAIENGNKERANELLDYIIIDLSKDGDVIQAITTIDDKYNKRSHNYDSNSLKINYNIKVPNYISLELVNKYGNVYIDEILGYSNIAVKYGTLQAKNLSRGKVQPLNRIYLSYTSKVAQIEKCDWISIEMKYSKLNIEKAHAVSLITKYSNLKVADASSIVAESRYDNYTVDKVNNFVLTSGGYSDYILKNVSRKVNINASYSEIKIGMLGKDFTSLDLDNRYGSIKVNVDPMSVFEIIGHVRYGSISYPDNSKINKITESSETTISGTVGSGEPVGKMKITAKYTTVKINAVD